MQGKQIQDLQDGYNISMERKNATLSERNTDLQHNLITAEAMN